MISLDIYSRLYILGGMEKKISIATERSTERMVQAATGRTINIGDSIRLWNGDTYRVSAFSPSTGTVSVFKGAGNHERNVSSIFLGCVFKKTLDK